MEKVIATLRNDGDQITNLIKRENLYYLRHWDLVDNGMVDAHTIPMTEAEATKLALTLMGDLKIKSSMSEVFEIVDQRHESVRRT